MSRRDPIFRTNLPYVVAGIVALSIAARPSP